MLLPTHKVNIADKFSIGGNGRFVLFAGPCAIETEEMTLETAAVLKNVCSDLGINLVFKSSFDKANRSSGKALRGVGMERGLEILQKVKTELDLPIITDVHEPWQCEIVARVADILQIPAFLSRQTDLLVAAAKTGKAVNVKKGQFLAPWDMKNVVEKLRDTGNENILLCERGTSFGYNNLVVDMMGLVEMRSFGYPVVFDATHSVQKPGGQGTSTGGNREMIPCLMRAALAVGVDAVFAEVHPDPEHAFSDGPNQIYLSDIRNILEEAVQIDNLIKASPAFQAPSPTSIPLRVLSPKEKELGRKLLEREIREEERKFFQQNVSSNKLPIKLLLTDVDGVMTDAGMYYSETGDEMKKFNAHDGMGLQIIRQRGIKTGIITSENTKLVERRFNKLKLDYLVQGKRSGGKLEAAQEICAQENISLEEVAYIGDDINCIELLSAVGLAACPLNAVDEVKRIPNIIHLNKKGGDGCVREFVELIIKKHC